MINWLIYNFWKSSLVICPVVIACYSSGGSGSDEETDITEQQDKGQVTKKVQEVSEDDDDENDIDDDDDDDDDDEDGSESLTAVSALTVGDLIEVMKTKAKAVTSQPSSVVNQFKILSVLLHAKGHQRLDSNPILFNLFFVEISCNYFC